MNLWNEPVCKVSVRRSGEKSAHDEYDAHGDSSDDKGWKESLITFTPRPDEQQQRSRTLDTPRHEQQFSDALDMEAWNSTYVSAPTLANSG